jgi:hypothetical protein
VKGYRKKGTEVWGDLNALRNKRSASRYRDMGEERYRDMGDLNALRNKRSASRYRDMGEERYRDMGEKHSGGLNLRGEAILFDLLHLELYTAPS